MATAIPTLFLSVDKTGSSLANRRVNELHRAPSRTIRVIKPNFSPFYTKGLTLTSVSPLGVRTLCQRGVHYSCVELRASASQESGLEVCCAIIVSDPALPELFEMTYQAVGGSANANLLAVAATAKNLSILGNPLDWDDILDKPRRFSPRPGHPHDAQDLYGLEGLCDELKRLADASDKGDKAVREHLTARTATLVASTRSTYFALKTTIADHLAAQTNPHRVTKDQVSLGFVENRSFAWQMRAGALEPYSSPKNVSLTFDDHLGRDMAQHMDDTFNPHLTNAQQLGLEKVVAHPLFTSYTLAYGAGGAQGSYNAQYFSQSTPSYVSAFSASRFTQEYGEKYKTLKLTGPLSAYTNAATGVVARASGLSAGAETTLATVHGALDIVNASLVSGSIALNEALLQTRAYRLLNANACASEMLLQILTLVYATTARVYPVPSKVPGLLLWLDFADAATLTTQPDAEGLALMEIDDKSVHARRFSADSALLAPRYDSSEAAAFAGKSLAKFTSGAQCLNQTSGDYLSLVPGFTAIVVARSGVAGSTLWVLSELNRPVSALSSAGIVVHGPASQALVLKGTSDQVLIEAPDSTSTALSASIAVACVSAQGSEQSWLACNNPAPLGVAPLGVGSALSETQLASLNFADLNRIGAGAAGIMQAGEIAEVLLYDHQLSKREVAVLVKYLQLKWGNHASLALDLNFVENAFLPA